MKKMMYRETSSEESEEKSDGGSDYEVSESSDDGSLENKAINTRRRAKSVMISIPEATKMRPRNSRNISKREPTESPILVDSTWQQRRNRNTARLPAQRFKNPIVASSSSAANIVPVSVSSQAQVNNVSVGTITTSLISQVNASTGNITTSFESGLNPSSSRIQDSFFGSSSSSGSNIKKPSNALGSSNSSVEAHANITRQMTSSSQPLLSLAMPNYQQQHDPSSMHGRGFDLNQSADEETKVEEEVESLDLNQPANEDDDGRKDEGIDLNQPARDE